MHLFAYETWDSYAEKHPWDLITSSHSPMDEIIILIEEDDDSEPEDTNIPRPKIGLPKRCINTAVKFIMDQGTKQEDMDVEQITKEDEIFQSMSCMPGLRDKSLEELRLECYLQCQVATGKPPSPASTPSSAIPPSFSPWCQSSSDDTILFEVSKNKRIRSHLEVASFQQEFTSPFCRFGCTKIVLQ